VAHLQSPSLGSLLLRLMTCRAMVEVFDPPPHGVWLAYVVEVEVKLRLTVSWPVWLGVGLPSGAHDQILFLSDNCRFLDLGHPLWREDGSVIYSYNKFWALPEQSLLGPSLAELDNHILLSHLRHPQPRWPNSCTYIPGTVWPVIPLGTGFPFRHLLRLIGLWQRYSPINLTRLSQRQSQITTDSQLARLSWFQAPIWDPRPIFLLFSLIIFRQLWVCWCGAHFLDCLCGLAVRVLGYRSGGPGSIPGTTRKKK
jgi:hypothetical protein